MDFDGKEKVIERVSQNQTLAAQVKWLQQVSMQAAEALREATGDGRILAALSEQLSSMSGTGGVRFDGNSDIAETDNYGTPLEDRSPAGKARAAGQRADQNVQDRGGSGWLRDHKQNLSEGSENREDIQMIGYLSGPITGNSDYEKQFAQAAEALTRKGYDVINPAALNQAIPLTKLSYARIMEIDLLLLSMADFLVQLPGWESSVGANRELSYALATDKLVVLLEDLLKEGSHADEPARNL